jgi:hypothetical protein
MVDALVYGTHWLQVVWYRLITACLVQVGAWLMYLFMVQVYAWLMHGLDYWYNLFGAG